MGKLSALRVKSAKPGRHADGDGLYLLVKESGSRSWMLRVQVDGKRRDIGLGSASVLGLADARDKAAEMRKLAKSGVDPVAERKKKPVAIPTFEQATRDCHAELKKGWKNQKHIDSWLASMINHIVPAIGDKPVDAVTSIMVRDAIAPIWMEMPETAQRILQRIGVVLDFAHIKGWRPDETSLRSVRKGLPRQPNVENHFEAMPYADVPDYMAKLAGAVETVGRDALRFTILTAVRSNETRFANWAEIDREKATWSIPASRMKMKQPHVVPLSTDAMAIINRRWEARTHDAGLIFPSTLKKPGGEERPISDMTMTKVLREDKVVGFTVHGFRSSFTDWAAEETNFRKEIVDKALAHKLPDRVEAAYRRTDFFEKRKKLMDAWARYVTGHQAVTKLAAVA
ncbi:MULTISPECIES: tyrosine-type recombinase/integrase [unclassified Sphingomonas]|uniref:tyrosine-type recombinase/integrase n=1 Tax=unclassified Sphingomonas TaxID=196159 RepID=UPI002150E7B0|nr:MULTISPECIES: site-specific integrase [unclassified Sphingomonas]MCR5872244.1 integrase arm-type DNA-binding domain-containing protein [Sphingomonas sp. J344]UUX99449.1 integrase arm-type DNA-binding domain-containing protein [Sphingomonas sp. J315]